MREETIGCPMDDITSDFFDKFIFDIIDPAFTNEFEQAINPVENNCQTAMPNTA